MAVKKNSTKPVDPPTFLWTLKCLICNTQKISVSCISCFCSSVSEENLDIVTLPAPTDTWTSKNQFLKPEINGIVRINGFVFHAMFFQKVPEKRVINSAPILIIQLC